MSEAMVTDTPKSANRRKGGIVRQYKKQSVSNCFPPDEEMAEIERRRLLSEIPIAQLALAAGMTPQGYRLLKAGKRQPRRRTIMALKKCLDAIADGGLMAVTDDHEIYLGAARDTADLRRILVERRKSLGMTQLEVDDKAGFQQGYTGKLELGQAAGGRNFGAMSLGTMLETLGVELKVVAVRGRK